MIQLDDGPRGQFSHVAHRLEVGTGDMGAENDGGQAEQRISRFGRFVVEHVQTGAGEMPRDQAVAEIGLDNQAAAGGVDQQAAGRIFARNFRSTMPRVASVSGKCRLMMSDSATSSSRPRRLI